MSPKFSWKKLKRIAEILKNGGIGVLPTDTIYGLVGSAQNQKTIRRIYGLRKRDFRKPLIILISSLKDLKLFSVKLSTKTKRLFNKLWPGKVSVILPCPSKKFSYLHRGTKTLAFRLPREKFLREFLKMSGPLVAPSANLQGLPSASTIKEAKKYFGAKVDFYVNVGKLNSAPSTLISVRNGKITVLKEGVAKIRI